MLTDGVLSVVLAVVVTGTYGAASLWTNPVGPVWYLLLAVSVVVEAGAAWRRDAVVEAEAASFLPSFPS